MVQKKVFNLVLDGLKQGLTVSESCTIAGIARDTFYRRVSADKKYSLQLEQLKINSNYYYSICP